MAKYSNGFQSLIDHDMQEHFIDFCETMQDMYVAGATHPQIAMTMGLDEFEYVLTYIIAKEVPELRHYFKGVCPDGI